MRACVYRNFIQDTSLVHKVEVEFKFFFVLTELGRIFAFCSLTVHNLNILDFVDMTRFRFVSHKTFSIQTVHRFFVTRTGTKSASRALPSRDRYSADLISAGSGLENSPRILCAASPVVAIVRRFASLLRVGVGWSRKYGARYNAIATWWRTSGGKIIAQTLSAEFTALDLFYLERKSPLLCLSPSPFPSPFGARNVLTRVFMWFFSLCISFFFNWLVSRPRVLSFFPLWCSIRSCGKTSSHERAMTLQGWTIYVYAGSVDFNIHSMAFDFFVTCRRYCACDVEYRELFEKCVNVELGRRLNTNWRVMNNRDFDEGFYTLCDFREKKTYETQLYIFVVENVLKMLNITIKHIVLEIIVGLLFWILWIGLKCYYISYYIIT